MPRIRKQFVGLSDGSTDIRGNRRDNGMPKGKAPDGRAHCTEHDRFRQGCRFCRIARRDQLRRERGA